MNKKAIAFTASDQTLTKTDGLEQYASNTVSYVEATFTLGTNWTGFDSVRAVWHSQYYDISTVLNAQGKCDVPAEVMYYKSKVFVNLVGITTAGDEISVRLTTYPILAFTVDSEALVEGTETGDITPSQFDQFVEQVSDDAASAAASAAAAAASAASLTVDSAMSTSSTNPVQNKVISGAVFDLKEEITEKMVFKESTNKVESDNDFTDGYMSIYGTINSDSTYQYSPKIPVNPGDVIRCYATRNGSFGINNLRFVTGFDTNDTAYSALGSTEDSQSFTVRDGTTSVVISVRKGSDYVVTINETVTQYVPYFAPYYVAEYEFIADALDEYEVPNITPKGYNMIADAITGDGFYYASGNRVVKGTDDTYSYYILQVKQNTDYLLRANTSARFWILTDNEDNVINSGSYLSYYINTGNATRLYLSYSKSVIDVSVIEGFNGTTNSLQKPEFLNNVSLLLQTDKYACSMPRNRLRFTQGINETFYLENMFSLDPSEIRSQLTLFSKSANGFTIDTSTLRDSVNGYRFSVYDSTLTSIDGVNLRPLSVKARNLQNCTALVLGDSQIEQGYITQDMLDAFSADNKTLTLYGTRGTAPNLTEGRAGWTAKQYCTMASSGNVTNEFWNPSTEKFDFAYYMNQHSHTSVDFVIINLGGNDLYNVGIEEDSKIIETANYIFEIIESILAFNANQKIILDLAPATSSDVTKQINPSWIVRNVYTRYNNYMQVKTMDYADNVRTSYTHLVVDPTSDLRDHIHETEAGYLKMANELINQINNWQNS